MNHGIKLLLSIFFLINLSYIIPSLLSSRLLLGAWHLLPELRQHVAISFTAPAGTNSLDNLPGQVALTLGFWLALNP